MYEILKNKISGGQYKPGERVLETKLSLELGVSRSPIPEAFGMLERDELVVGTNGGVAVNLLQMEDIEEVYQCRMEVEPFASKASGRTPYC